MSACAESAFHSFSSWIQTWWRRSSISGSSAGSVSPRSPITAIVGHDVLAHLGAVQFKVDDLGLLGKRVQAAGDAVVKAHAHGDQHVAALDGAVGIGFAVHAAHAQAQRVAFGDVAGAQQRRHHRDLGLFDQLAAVRG